jgi:hypothetical protein
MANENCILLFIAKSCPTDADCVFRPLSKAFLDRASCSGRSSLEISTSTLDHGSLLLTLRSDEGTRSLTDVFDVLDMLDKHVSRQSVNEGWASGCFTKEAQMPQQETITSWL